MKTGLAVLLAVAMATAAGAQAPRRRAVRSAPPTVVSSDDFLIASTTLGWEAGFSDYSPIHENIVERVAELRPGLGFFLSSHNRSDDMFMFLKKKLTVADGIRPSQAYEVSFFMRLASQAGSGCIGIGGSPGESVYLKAGASGEEPKVILVPNELGSHYRLTVDKGNQSVGGPAASVVGNIANATSNCSGDAPFVTIEKTHRHPFVVHANESGEIWLLVGTDSGFEGKTSLYYEVISATLVPAG